MGSAGQNGFHDIALAKGPGVVIGRSGASFGQVHFCSRDYWPHNTGLYVTDFKGNDPQFAYYLLKALDFDRYNSGSAQPSLNRNFIYPIPICVPEIAEQKAISAVLATLDEKIELNRRMNATLETMARTLFQSWFVDFDPVSAKLDESISPSLDTVAALFPAKFQDSPIGPVPKGWKVERFDAHITVERGLSYKGEGLRSDRTGLPMHNLNSVYEGGGYKHEGIKYYDGEYRDKHLLEPGDMIVTNTEQGFDHLLIGHAAIVPAIYGPKGLYSHHIYRVRHKPSSPFSPHYLVELFNNRRWHYWISGFSNGTTINMLPKDALEMPLLVVPPVELVKKFSALAGAVHLQIENNKQQSRTLAALRDTVLPKLLSGELRVAQAKEDVPNIVPFPDKTSKESPKKTTNEFVEAVVIAQLVRKLATPEHPLGRKRYNKFAYLAHRKADEDVSQHYLKKAAGPYSPWAKYGGPEKIAEKNGYVEQGKAGVFTGLVVGKKIEEIDRYLANYPVCAAIDWIVEKFRFKKNDDLELLATVDFAALDLRGEGKPLTREMIKQVILANKEWAPKLDRAIFSDTNVDRALAELATLFPATYQS